MVPSMRVLPRCWVVVAVLLAVLLSFGLIAWLALEASALVARSTRPAAPEAPEAPAPHKCPDAFPERGCPAVRQTLLALHCKAVNSTLFELHLEDLFAAHMAEARAARAAEEEDDEDDDEDEDNGDMLDDDVLGQQDEDAAQAGSSFVTQTQSALRKPALPRERPRKAAGPQQQGQRGQRGQRGHQRERQGQGRHNRRAPDTTTTMVCYLLVTLLVASAVLAVGEVLRDWWATKALAAALDEDAARPHPHAPGLLTAGAALAAVLDAERRGQQLSRRCSLVDLTVSRHERRESMAAAHAHAHGSHANHGAGHVHMAAGQAGIGKTSSMAAPGLYDARGLHRCLAAAPSPLRRPSVAALRFAHPPGAGPGAGGGHLAAWESVEDP